MKDSIKRLVDEFLKWRLPNTVASDACVIDPYYPHLRFGTNLLNAAEAEQLMQEVVGPELQRLCEEMKEDRRLFLSALYSMLDFYAGQVDMLIAKKLRELSHEADDQRKELINAELDRTLARATAKLDAVSLTLLEALKRSTNPAGSQSDLTHEEGLSGVGKKIGDEATAALKKFETTVLESNDYWFEQYEGQRKLAVRLGCTVSRLQEHATEAQAEARRYWELLCKTVEAMGKVAPEAAPYAPEWAADLLARKEKAEAEVAQLKQELRDEQERSRVLRGMLEQGDKEKS